MFGVLGVYNFAPTPKKYRRRWMVPKTFCVTYTDCVLGHGVSVLAVILFAVIQSHRLAEY